MNILLISATEKEMEPFRSISSGKHTIDFHVSGAGMVATTYSLTKLLSVKKYDLAIDLGVAGSFNRTLAIGEVVNVSEDVFSETGAEDDDKFISLAEMGLEGKIMFRSTAEPHSDSLAGYRQVRGITVNTVHGNEESISRIIKRLNPDIETMEGAAFFYVCEKENIPCIQLRGISNYVEKRNRESWNIPLALKNLYNVIKELIDEIG